VSILRQLAAGQKRWWAAASTYDKCRCVLVASTVLLATWVWFGVTPDSPAYVPLCTGLSHGETEAIRMRLEADHIPFQAADGGRTILVPADMCAELTIEYVQRVSGGETGRTQADSPGSGAGIAAGNA